MWRSLDLSEASVVIIGGGQAGFQVASSLRTDGFTGHVTLIGNESSPPYQRPPLSKAYLLGKQDREGLLLRPANWYAENGIDLITGRMAVAIDRQRRCVLLEDGASFPFDELVIATGARVRKLSIEGAELDGVEYVRSLADADRIRGGMAVVGPVVVIGGGFIGLEFAAVARQMGKTVTVLEAQPRLMARVVAPVISEYFQSLHRRHGVDIRLGQGVTKIYGADGKVTSVMTSTGELLPADLVVAGIGVEANDGLAVAAGLTCHHGIDVDAQLLTDDPHIYAVGDCVQHHNVFADARMRVESVQNAVDQARCVASAIMGRAAPYRAVPWFWSDQYDIKLQMVGFSSGFDGVTVRGSPENDAFSTFYHLGGKLIGVDSVNRSGDHMLGRRLLAQGISIPAHVFADESINLKSYLA